MLGYLLHAAGLPVNSVQVENVGGVAARLLAVVEGQAVATIDPVAQWDALTPSERSGLHLLINESQFLTAVPYQSKVNVVSVKTLETKRAALQLFVTLTMKLARFYYGHPGQFARAVAGQNNSGLTFKPIEQAASAPGFRQQWCVNGCLNKDLLAHTAAVLYRNNALPNTATISLDQWVYPGLVKKSLAQIGVMKGLDAP